MPPILVNGRFDTPCDQFVVCGHGCFKKLFYAVWRLTEDKSVSRKLELSFIALEQFVNPLSELLLSGAFIKRFPVHSAVIESMHVA